jgi:prolyl-tRNA synthetase
MSTSIEGMMQDKKALQAGTSHYFGQNFSRAFNIQYLDPGNSLQYCETTSWGLSTRMIGAIIMVHGDDQGLILPPRIAPTQIVLVPIYKNDAERSRVMDSANRVWAELKTSGLRTKMDDREEVTPGFKFNDWEMRGVPLRIEIGPRDVENGSATLARRDGGGKGGRSSVSQSALTSAAVSLLDDVQTSMLARATAFRDANIHDPRTFDELKEVVQDGWAYSWWCGSAECETRIKNETKATSRNIPLDQPDGKGKCIVCGRPADKKVYFARAY